LARILARLFMLFGGQWFRVRGTAPDPGKGPYLYLMNHESLFDGFMMVAGIRHYFTGVGAVEQFSYPIWGYLVKKYGVIPIVRQKQKTAITSMNKLEEAIKKGTFPGSGAVPLTRNHWPPKSINNLARIRAKKCSR